MSSGEMEANISGLARLGWGDFFQQQYTAHTELTPVRVSIEHQDRYTVIGDEIHTDAHLTGRLLQEANTGGARPVVGDWVGLSSQGLIAHLFERSTAVRRSNSRGKVQVIAANIDLVLIVSSCNAEFNTRRIERYLSAVWQSGAKAAIVLSKTDLCDDVEHYLRALQRVSGETPIYPVATPSGDGLGPLRSALQIGKTLALVGSSGVGKSTLANALLGVELFETAAIREQDAKGRHTTTRRELVVLGDGRGVLIDTPGMRELQLSADGSDTDRDDVFDDIHQLAQECRFRDCQHQKEPGCEVRDQIDPARLRNFRSLRAERSGSKVEQLRHNRAVHRGSFNKKSTTKKNPKKR